MNHECIVLPSPPREDGEETVTFTGKQWREKRDLGRWGISE